MAMKRTKLINDPAELVALFRSVDSPGRRAVLARLAEGWTPTSELQESFGEEAFGAITYFEKFKLVESRWEVLDGKPEKAYRTFYNAFQISTSLNFVEAQELLTVVLMEETVFEALEVKILEMVGEEGCFANDISRELELTSLQLKGLVRRSVKFDYRGHNIVPIKEEK
ncbi:MAG: ArsR family transcriptional regulator [Candidatus Poseidoniia archaeon]|uniref:ArsR family transcriptional regulator n=1 Tax=marine metagenome TaxID=408172 RepID=A0A381TD68_9ZZZZ|nr:ArsR family transcriptional regulator [Candidatus Poseidoniia archaeon]MDP7474257.1 ArsR family transcriptional regulator [Candidatus Poseidoniia archaeon]